MKQITQPIQKGFLCLQYLGEDTGSLRKKMAVHTVFANGIGKILIANLHNIKYERNLEQEVNNEVKVLGWC